MNIVAVVLTYNEQKHISRCLISLRHVVDRVLVVDSFSTDNTVEISLSLGAKVVRHAWVNHSAQFNWALDQLDGKPDWVLRIDADEVITPELAVEIRSKLPYFLPIVSGVAFNRKIVFQGRLMKHGGVGAIKALRLFRFGSGRSENRWMDEHIKVTGDVCNVKGDLIDHNLNSLNWWTNKHNQYASKEVVDLLNLEYGFMPYDSVASISGGGVVGIKRWLKERVYARLPIGLRAFAYFLYRFLIRFGFLDGKEGIVFHFLQGFWYRFLVDAKLAEVRRCMEAKDMAVIDAIREVLEIDVRCHVEQRK